MRPFSVSPVDNTSMSQPMDQSMDKGVAQFRFKVGQPVDICSKRGWVVGWVGERADTVPPRVFIRYPGPEPGTWVEGWVHEESASLAPHRTHTLPSAREPQAPGDRAARPQRGSPPPPSLNAKPVPADSVEPLLDGPALLPDEPELSAGAVVDVRDKVGKWLEAEVVKKQGTWATVHFLQWGSTWDEAIDFSKQPERFSSIHTFTAAGKHEYQQGQWVYVRAPRCEPSVWVSGVIRKVAFSQVLVRFFVRDKSVEYWFHAQSGDITTALIAKKEPAQRGARAGSKRRRKKISLPPHEEKHYTEWFNHFKRSGRNVLRGSDIKKFLASSGLPKKVLARVWALSARTKKALAKDDFFLALRLVAMAQAQLPVTVQSVRLYPDVPPATFQGFAGPAKPEEPQNHEVPLEVEMCAQCGGMDCACMRSPPTADTFQTDDGIDPEAADLLAALTGIIGLQQSETPGGPGEVAALVEEVAHMACVERQTSLLEQCSALRQQCAALVVGSPHSIRGRIDALIHSWTEREAQFLEETAQTAAILLYRSKCSELATATQDLHEALKQGPQRHEEPGDGSGHGHAQYGPAVQACLKRRDEAASAAYAAAQDMLLALQQAQQAARDREAQAGGELKQSHAEYNKLLATLGHTPEYTPREAPPETESVVIHPDDPAVERLVAAGRTFCDAFQLETKCRAAAVNSVADSWGGVQQFLAAPAPKGDVFHQLAAARAQLADAQIELEDAKEEVEDLCQRAQEHAGVEWALHSGFQAHKKAAVESHQRAVRRVQELGREIALLRADTEKLKELVSAIQDRDLIHKSYDQHDEKIAELEVNLFRVGRRGRGSGAQADKLKQEIEQCRMQPDYLRALSGMRRLALLLPEIAAEYDPVKHPISPLRGTAAQQLPVRSLAHDYTSVQPTHAGVGGRHETFTAFLTARDSRSGPSSEENKSREVKEEAEPDVAAPPKVFLKCFTLGDGPSALKPLRRAAHILSRVRHRHIVPVTAVATHYDNDKGALYFLEMPALPSDLRKWLDSDRAREVEGKDGLQRVTRLLKGLCEGLAAIHAAGIVHRDFKPGNVLLDEQGEPVLTDFETAKDTALNSATTTGVQLGTAGYIAPEPERTSASDMYALGVVLSEIATGQRLARAEQVTAAAETGNYPLLSHEPLRELLDQLLSTQPQRRPSAEQVLGLPWVQSPPPSMQCGACLEHFVVTQGVLCGNRDSGVDGGASHFTCRECFSSYIQHLSTEDMGRVRARQGQAVCFHAPQGCRAVYSDQVVALNCTAEAAQAHFIECRRRLVEAEVVPRLEQEQKDRVDAEVKRLMALSKDQRKLESAVRHVQDLLNPKCPRCRTPFVDFTGCFALTCRHCKCSFCAWCLKDCGVDSHAHVARCRHNLAGGNVYSTLALFAESHRRRVQKSVNKYLASLPVSIRSKVAERVAPDLSDLGIANRYLKKKDKRRSVAESVCEEADRVA